jgi:NADH-quinone oxidoreductase subunit D
MVINMGPQHPSTHGVLRLILTLDGETVTEPGAVIGYLHTGIEKNMEYRTGRRASRSAPGWTTWRRSSTRPPTAWAWRSCSASTDKIPERVSVIRVLMMELNRISSHLVGLGDRSAWSWARPPIFIGFNAAGDRPLDLFELDHRAADEPVPTSGPGASRRTCRPTRRPRSRALKR